MYPDLPNDNNTMDNGEDRLLPKQDGEKEDDLAQEGKKGIQGSRFKKIGSSGLATTVETIPESPPGGGERSPEEDIGGIQLNFDPPVASLTVKDETKPFRFPSPARPSTNSPTAASSASTAAATNTTTASSASTAAAANTTTSDAKSTASPAKVSIAAIAIPTTSSEEATATSSATTPSALSVQGRKKSPRSPPPGLTLNLPPHDPVDFGNGGGGGGNGSNAPTGTSLATCGSTTAPVFQNDRVRFFSFSNARRNMAAADRIDSHHDVNSTVGPGVPSAASISSSQRPPMPARVRYLRQNTVGGGGGESHLSRQQQHQLTRAISRTYTLTSNASSSIGAEEWRSIFEKLDLESDGRADGHIPLGKFREILEDDPVWSEAVPREVQEQILGNADQNGDGLIDYEEFIDLVRGTHIGLSSRKRRAVRELLKQTVEFIVPYKYSYQNQYSCSPPPLFMLGVSLLQAAIFAYNSAVMYAEIRYIGLNGPVPYCSRLIYDPDKREQVWRYLTYMFIHSGLFHATFNILIQLVLGIPLEMVHGWWRVMLVYLSGVLAGSLWTSVLRPNVFLSGASGGVYALITAHLGTVIMNFREMECPWCRILIVLVVALTDTVVYVYDMYVAGHTNPVSYPAHISGAATGLLVGIVALKNLRWEPHERYIWAVSTFTFVALMLTAIVWNLAVPGHFTGLAVEIPCISARVL